MFRVPLLIAAILVPAQALAQDATLTVYLHNAGKGSFGSTGTAASQVHIAARSTLQAKLDGPTNLYAPAAGTAAPGADFNATVDQLHSTAKNPNNKYQIVLSWPDTRTRTLSLGPYALKPGSNTLGKSGLEKNDGIDVANEAPPAATGFSCFPSAPNLAANLFLSWSNPAPMPEDFSRVEIHRATQPGFTPTPATLVANLPYATSSHRLSGLTPNTRYYFCVRVVDAYGAATDLCSVKPCATQKGTAPSADGGTPVDTDAGTAIDPDGGADTPDPNDPGNMQLGCSVAARPASKAPEYGLLLLGGLLLLRRTRRTLRRRGGPLLALAIASCGGTTGGGADASMPPPKTIWHPLPGITWDWQLVTPINQGADVQAYDIDLFDNDASVISALHKSGRKVICYVDIGSYENYRPDAPLFPAAILGATYVGFPDERWLDIRRIDLLGPILTARFDQALTKGCDAIEPDNVDGYNTMAHESSGFPLTYADQITFNRWAVAQVHMRSMSIALKNDGDQVKDLVGDFDFALSEQAFQYQEQNLFVPFIMAGKAVLETEYNLQTSQFCTQANQLNFSAILKHQNLDSYREACR